MDGSAAQTFLSDLLHVIAQALLAPDILLLLAFIGYALFCIGSIVAECFSERRHFKVAMPKFLADLMAAEEDEIPAVIENSGLLNRQKTALLTVYDYRILPGDALVALIKRLVSQEESRYDHITDRNGMAARVSPMLGLMGTLIPLGPGIQALGKADVELLSSSLLVAFDTTVAGLVVAAVCMVIGKIRSSWYTNYMSALDSGMATMLQKIEDMRAEGKIQVQEPTNYSFIFEEKTKAKSKERAAKHAKDNNAATVEDAAGQASLGAHAGWADSSAAAAANAAGAYQMNVDGAGVMQDAEMPFLHSPTADTQANTLMGDAYAVPERPVQSDGGFFNPYANAGATADYAPADYSYAGPQEAKGGLSAAGLPTIDVSLTTNSNEAPVQVDAQQIPTVFGAADTGQIAMPADAPTVASVAPSFDEIAMPSFLDALETPASSVEATIEAESDADQSDTDAAQEWQRQSDEAQDSTD